MVMATGCWSWRGASARAGRLGTPRVETRRPVLKERATVARTSGSVFGGRGTPSPIPWVWRPRPRLRDTYWGSL